MNKYSNSQMWLWVPISLVLSACHWLEFCRNSIKAFNLVAPNIFHSRQFLFFECSIVDSCHEKRLDYKTRFDRNRSEFSTLISPYALVATYPAKLKKNINHCMFSFAGVMADSKLSQQGFFYTSFLKGSSIIIVDRAHNGLTGWILIVRRGMD